MSATFEEANETEIHLDDTLDGLLEDAVTELISHDLPSLAAAVGTARAVLAELAGDGCTAGAFACASIVEAAERQLFEVLRERQLVPYAEMPRYRCASPNCPGYVWPASTLPHPTETCGGSRRSGAVAPTAIPDRYIERDEAEAKALELAGEDDEVMLELAGDGFRWRAQRAEFLRDNAEDAETVERVRALGPGESVELGGGATPPVIVRRLDRGES